jgi:hypothetical protein
LAGGYGATNVMGRHGSPLFFRRARNTAFAVPFDVKCAPRYDLNVIPALGGRRSLVRPLVLDQTAGPHEGLATSLEVTRVWFHCIPVVRMRVRDQIADHREALTATRDIAGVLPPICPHRRRHVSLDIVRIRQRAAITERGAEETNSDLGTRGTEDVARPPCPPPPAAGSIAPVSPGGRERRGRSPERPRAQRAHIERS